MELKINQKLFTKDGRIIGNCFVSGIDKNQVTLVSESGKTVILENGLIETLFHIRDGNLVQNCYLDVIGLADEGGMSLSYLKGLLYKRISLITKFNK